MRTKLLIAVLSLLFTHTIASAEMYQWVDKNGVVTFKDTPPPVTKERGKVKVYKDSDFDAAPPPPPVAAPSARPLKAGSAAPVAPTPVEKPRFTGTVELYGTSWCGYCKQAERYMQSKGIPYVAYDIEKDNSAKQRHKALGGRGVPLIVVGSRTISGFSPQAIEQYLRNPY